MNSIEIGFVVEVNGYISKVAVFDNANHRTFISNGELIKNVSVNSFIVISQGFVKIIGRITAETTWDTQNFRDYSLDRRFTKNSIRRVLEVQTIGYIEDGAFFSGASYLPMIGDSSLIPSKDDIHRIYLNNYIDGDSQYSVVIGESLNEQNEITLPINLFFASHIGVFGNTGSGKSNTLHRLYYELFRTDTVPKLREKSNFLIMDFNGEYVHPNSFGITERQGKTTYNLSTQGQGNIRFPINKKTFFDKDMLAILYQATNQTQKPFLARVLTSWHKYENDFLKESESIAKWVCFLIREIFRNEANKDVKNRLVAVLEELTVPMELLEGIQAVDVHSFSNTFYFMCKNCGEAKGCTAYYKHTSCPLGKGNGLYFNGDLRDEHEGFLNIANIEKHISDMEIDMLSAFVIRCKLQLINDVFYGNVVHEHISPLIPRILSTTNDIKKYIDISSEDEAESFLKIVSFRRLNQDAKRILSILISKMYFDKHKKKATNEGSFHLIVDEAHNILSTQAGAESDSWKDYRLELFEEIIKEGRKFAFFLTLSSQRPADISPTILSQVHNFFLHKLVNERDLMIIDNSISTLDRVTKSTLPVLSQGVCIVSGTAVSMPITVKVNFIEEADVRPQSDTIDLVEIWRGDQL